MQRIRRERIPGSAVSVVNMTLCGFSWASRVSAATRKLVLPDEREVLASEVLELPLDTSATDAQQRLPWDWLVPLACTGRTTCCVQHRVHHHFGQESIGQRGELYAALAITTGPAVERGSGAPVLALLSARRCRARRSRSMFASKVLSLSRSLSCGQVAIKRLGFPQPETLFDQRMRLTFAQFADCVGVSQCPATHVRRFDARRLQDGFDPPVDGGLVETNALLPSS